MTEQIADQILRLQAAGSTFVGHPVNPEGVWAVVDLNVGESITMVFPSEIEALRKLNGRGYGRVCFLPFGKDLHDIDTEEAQMQKLRDQLSSAIPASSNSGQA